MVRTVQALILISAVAAALIPTSSRTIERLYSAGIYPKIQAVVTPITNLVPFAVFDVLSVLAVVGVVGLVFGGVGRAIRERRFQPLGTMVLSLATAAAAAYLVFLALWGLNYRRVPMTERLVTDRDAPTTEQVVKLGFQAIQQLNALHKQAHREGWERDPRDSTRLLEAYRFVQRRLGDTASAVPGRLKPSIYGPYFRWTTVDGMIDPFGLEILANPDLLPYERTFVAAHEWAHLAGFADEAEANFVAWLTCVRADVPAQYSGWLGLYWQIGSEVDPENRQRLWDAVADGPRRDIQAISDRLQRGQLPFLRNASWRVYDQYLRANRVEEGVRSYGQVINLILRSRFEDDWAPVRRSSISPGP